MTSPPVAAGQLRQPRLAELVAATLREEILAGVHPDGTCLPRQEDLIARFRVSPPSLREALRILETEGLLTVQRGKIGGAVVHTPRPGKVAYMLGLVLQHRAVDLRDIADTLSRLDPECARRCAERAGRAGAVVPALRANLEESRRALSDAARYAALARSFHELLVASCGSETMTVLVGTLESLWSAHVAELSRPTPATPRTPVPATGHTTVPPPATPPRPPAGPGGRSTPGWSISSRPVTRTAPRRAPAST